MSSKTLTNSERSYLLKLARESITAAVGGDPLPQVNLDALPEALRINGASFVTLTMQCDLRGCIGTLEAHQPLALDVQEHAISAALEDPRFLPVTERELSALHIEISRLTQPEPLQYDRPEDLPGKLRPGVDGVILRDGYLRATFLPQVWDELRDPADFLSHLCRKMHAPADAWRQRVLQVWTYNVEAFDEE